MLNLFSFVGRNDKKNKDFKFWQTGSHAIELHNEGFVWDKVNYIHNNPVKDGFVEKAEDWRYSSASNYLEKENSILNEVICLKPILKTY